MVQVITNTAETGQNHSKLSQWNIKSTADIFYEGDNKHSTWGEFFFSFWVSGGGGGPSIQAHCIEALIFWCYIRNETRCHLWYWYIGPNGMPRTLTETYLKSPPPPIVPNLIQPTHSCSALEEREHCACACMAAFHHASCANAWHA